MRGFLRPRRKSLIETRRKLIPNKANKGIDTFPTVDTDAQVNIKHLLVSGVQLVIGNLDELIEIDVVMSKPVFGVPEKM